MSLISYVVWATLLLGFNSVELGDDLPRQEAERLWTRARQSQRAHVHGIESFQGRYTMRLYDGVTGRYRDYRVEFAFEDGMLLDSRIYSGKSWQHVDTEWVGGGGEMNIENASPGGRDAEIRRRDGGSSILVGRKGGLPLLSCSLPHTIAEYPVLAPLLEQAADTPIAARWTDAGRIQFDFKFPATQAIWAITCDSTKGYMPERIETWMSGDRTQPPDAITEAVYTALRSADGSTWFYPTSGRKMFREDEGRVSQQWEVDLASLEVNTDIPDSRFLLTPREDEALVRDGDFKLLQRPRVQAEDTRATRNNAAPVPEDSAARTGFTQEVYGGRNWWRIAGTGVGVTFITAGAIVIFRRRGK